MKRFAILSLIIFSISLTIYAQDKWSPNSYSIIKETTTEVFCTSPTEYTSIEKRIISVTNERGKDAINFVVTCDKFREMKSFSGTIVDNQGNIIKKIKKNDLKKTEYSNEMASDDYYYYYDYIPIKYPITITYEWEMKIKKGYLSFPTFAPQQDYNQTVERAYYKLTTPKEITPLIHLANIPEGNISKKENQENNTIEIELLNLQPVIEETYAPPIKERIPHAFIIPAKFHFDGSNGKQSSWTELGKWQYELLEGRDILPPALLEEVLKITADCTTPLEKVKAIYDFLGRTTRYVSIQLGIGGLQPASATDVYRTGFGDCKALTNYTRAMLASIGIPSYYTVISTEDVTMIREFSSVNQGNHVILQVPMINDTLWLECTNPKLPLGYVHQSIAGHDAMVVKPSGGEIHTLPNYPDSLNKQIISAHIEINPKEETKIQVNMISHAFQYEDKFGMEKLPPNKLKDVFLNSLDLGRANITNIEYHELKKSYPESTYSYTINTSQYGRKTGKRLFLPINIFHRNFAVPNNNSERTQPIQIEYGYMDTDSITIRIPEGYEIEYIPESKSENNIFGNYTFEIKLQDSIIHIVTTLLVKRGTYPKELFSDLIAFRKTIKRLYDTEIVLKQKE